MSHSKLVVILAAFCGCSASPPHYDLQHVILGQVEGHTVVVEGRIDTLGVDLYSLQPFSVPVEQFDENCLPLLLSSDDVQRAKQLHGQYATITGELIPLADLVQAIPSHSGQVDGRQWSGTKCDSAYVLYVTRLTCAELCRN